MLFPKIVMHFVFWAVYNCNVGVKRFGENNCKQSYIIYTIFSFGHQLTWLCQNDHICRLIDNQHNMSQMNRDGKVGTLNPLQILQRLC